MYNCCTPRLLYTSHLGKLLFQTLKFHPRCHKPPFRTHCHIPQLRRTILMDLQTKRVMKFAFHTLTCVYNVIYTNRNTLQINTHLWITRNGRRNRPTFPTLHYYLNIWRSISDYKLQTNRPKVFTETLPVPTLVHCSRSHSSTNLSMCSSSSSPIPNTVIRELELPN